MVNIQDLISQGVTTAKKQFTRKELWLYLKPYYIKLACKRLGITLFLKQEEIIKDNNSTIVVRGGRNTAKSYDSAFIIYCLLLFAADFKYTLNIAIAAPKASSTKNVFRHLLQKNINKEDSGFLLKSPIDGLKVIYDNFDNNSTQPIKIRFENGTLIDSASCDTIGAIGTNIRGGENDVIIVDEFGEIEYKQEFIAASLYSLDRKSTTKTSQRMDLLYVMGNPDTHTLGMEFDNLFDKGQEPNLGIKSYHLKAIDSPYSSRDIDKRAKYLLSDDLQLREGEGAQIPLHGRLFPEFNKSKHVKIVKRDENFGYIIGLDFGPNNSMTVFFQYINNIVYVFDELHIQNNVVDFVVNEIEMKRQNKYNTGEGLILLGCDPAGDNKSDVSKYNQFDRVQKRIPQTQYIRGNKTLQSKSRQQEMLRILIMNDRLIIDENCKQLVWSIQMATAASNGGWEKKNNVDHALDALAYGLINYGPTSQLIIREKEEVTIMSEDDEYEMQNKLNTLFGG